MNLQGVRSTWLGVFTREPDRARSIASYRTLAADYETTTRRIATVRQAAIAALAVRPGETVFDIGCGAGATLPLLAAACGVGGRVLGVEQSPEMARAAAERIAGCTGIEVLNSPVEALETSLRADAMLFCYTHDILQSPLAVERLASYAKPGCRIAIAGMRFLPWRYGFAANAFCAFRARRYLTTYRGMQRPWARIAAACSRLEVVNQFHWGTSYLAVGCFAGEARP